jgi:hypothetical protein
MAARLTNELRAHLDTASADALVEVILEIRPATESVAPGASRPSRIAAGRQQFVDTVAPLQDRIQLLGGQVLEQVWLNHTLRARVPAHTVTQLAEAECVTAVDVPARLSRE